MNNKTIKNIAELLFMFLKRDLKERYVGSVMGFYWSIVNPLVLLILYWFVFSSVLKINFQGNNAALYIFTGMLPFLTFQESIQRSIVSISSHSGLIRNIVFPSELIPVNICLSAVVNQLIGLVILLIFVAFYQGIKGAILFLPILIVIQLLLTAGLSMAFSAINVFFPDVGHLMGIVLVVWIFITPIFYPADMIPENFAFILSLNPLAHLVEAYRTVILSGAVPDIMEIAVLLATAFISFTAGFAVFSLKKKHFGDVL